MTMTTQEFLKAISGEGAGVTTWLETGRPEDMQAFREKYGYTQVDANWSPRTARPETD